MRLRLLAAAVGGLLMTSPARAVEPAQPPVEVMVIGAFHMSNPGHDIHNLKVDDVLAPKRQAEIAAVTDALARFKPNKVGVEWPADIVAERYKQYLAGTLAPSHNEVVQLGFRLAKTAHAEGVYSLDADGDFPYDRLKNFAYAQGFKALLDGLDAQTQAGVDEQARVLADKGVGADLRLLNDPARIKADQGFYREVLRIGRGFDQPGVDLASAWYHRNFQICANLLDIAKPGDRIVVIFGSGHAFLLRQCVTETPGFKLVEANDYLPR
ncbi:DUF5694 domain-containing protein [Phenylobacterium sp.]|jgi:hypothetical protein|uniref:DUF5694 domain-containing protein n=1 Tax=Phenylobacterium sp. TaxID=1871053 RepID=UPI002F3F9698